MIIACLHCFPRCTHFMDPVEHLKWVLPTIPSLVPITFQSGTEVLLMDIDVSYLLHPLNYHCDIHGAFSHRDILLIIHSPLTFYLTIWQSYWPLSKSRNTPNLGTLTVDQFLQHCKENAPSSPLADLLSPSSIRLSHQLVTLCSLPSRMLPIHVGTAILKPSNFQFGQSEQFIGHHSCVSRIWQVQDGGYGTWGYLLMNMMKTSLILPVACSWMNHFHSITELFGAHAPYWSASPTSSRIVCIFQFSD